SGCSRVTARESGDAELFPLAPHARDTPPGPPGNLFVRHRSEQGDFLSRPPGTVITRLEVLCQVPFEGRAPALLDLLRRELLPAHLRSAGLGDILTHSPRA